MMIPITRKEKYINEIVGGGNTAPETPQTREEFFFAEILGEVVAPSPITRAEKYLAKIANKYSGELPEPVTRIERFLARAAGMDVAIPTPVTREEMFWADYALIVEKEISGIPPLTFNAVAGALKNYRIYGNTENGQSVGDKTGNLFDGKFLQGYWALADGVFIVSNQWICTKKIPCKANTDYTFTFGIISRWYGFAWYDIDGNYIEFVSGRIKSQPTIFTATSPANAAFMGIDIAGDSVGATNLDIHPSDVTDFMLVEGSTALPYEPYGYKVPVTVSNGTDTLTTPIYLPEPIKMVGDEAEYIDFEEQKQHFADGASADVTLPAMPTLSGTNMLTVGTEVQPSNVYIKYEGAR